MSPIVKKSKEKFSLPSRYYLLIFSIICILLMLLTFFTDFHLSGANVVVGYTIVPCQKGISAVGTFFYDKKELLKEIKALSAENEELKKEIDALTLENAKYQQDMFELASLRDLYNMNQGYTEYEMTGAKVISSSDSNWFNTFIIDKGSNDGITTDMNVLSGSGLVGRVTDVGPNWSRVLTIVDDNSNVSCTVLSSSDNLIVSGDVLKLENGYITFSNLIDDDNDVAVGDKVVTSNISDKFMPGIPVGYISYIETDSNNLTKSGYITPSVDFRHINDVLIILKTKDITE